MHFKMLRDSCDVVCMQATQGRLERIVNQDLILRNEALEESWMCHAL